MMILRIIPTLLASALVVTAVGLLAPSALRAQDPDETPIDPEAMTKTDSGLRYQDLEEGEGETPDSGQVCTVHYTGWLWEDGAKGRQFDSSVDRGQPFRFRVGMGMVIQGWDEGVASMKKGGKRLLLIPPELGYGEQGAGNVIPPNATLLFEVELLDFE